MAMSKSIDLSPIIDYVKDNPEAIKDSISRSDLLPHLFKIQGQPFSLERFPQFKVMYDMPYTPEMLFLCGRQTSKSSNLSRSEILDAIQMPHHHIIYVAPLRSQAQYYSSEYLQTAINTCGVAQNLQQKGGDESGPINKAVMHQSFGNGSSVILTYAKTSVDRGRGLYGDRIDFDEVQDQNVDNISIISKSLTQSHYGTRRYTGTAKTTDNTIHHLWNRSSQCEWAVKCSSCNHWNIPTLDNGVLEMIRVSGPSCCKCGKVLDVTTGIYAPAYPDRQDTFPGYHIPQIFLPEIVLTPRKWAALIHEVLNQPPLLTVQEILGISYSTGARHISQGDIDNCSVLSPMSEMMKKRPEYAYTVGGVDWGVSEKTSFTVHTIIGVKPDGKIHTLWARRFMGIDPDSVLKEIAKAHRYYRCELLMADFGMGFSNNVMLSKRFSLPVTQIAYTRQNQFLQYRPYLGHPRWTIDKVTALRMLFWQIKYRQILFPPQSEFAIYTRDLLSPYEEVTTSGGLEHVIFHRDPNQPDDFCHALCFAVIGAMRLMDKSPADIIPEAFDSDSEAETAIPAIEHIDPALFGH